MPLTRSLGVAASQAANRTQSILFAAAEKLGLLATQQGSKIPHILQVQPESIQRDWPNLDLPLACNVIAPFLPRTSEGCALEIDVDLHKISGLTWTEDDDVLAETIAVRVQIFLEQIIGTDLLYVWGRSSQGGTGHIYLRLEGNKAAIDNFQLRTGARAFRLGDFTFRIEARLPPPGKVPSTKGFALPGSIYPARTGSGVDPIVWRNLDTTLTAHSAPFQPLQPINADIIADAIYAATLGIVALSGWSPGNSHDAALRVSGVLARDVIDELLTEKQAQGLLQTICAMVGDADLQDRLKALETSIRSYTSGQPVSGWPAFGDFFGDGPKDALLRLRGKGDPSAFDTLRELVVWTSKVDGVDGDRYINLEAARAGVGNVVATDKGIRLNFSTDSRFPPIKTPKGKLPLINALLASSRLRKVPEVSKFPGIEPGTMMRIVRGVARIASEDEIVNEPCILNIGSGYATQRVEEPDPAAMAIWLKHWRKYLGPICHDNDADMLRLERAIALKIKEPLRKIALGICLTGGGGIGKTSLWLTILPKILGKVTGSLSLSNERSAYFASDLPGHLFMLADEADLTVLKTDMVEAVKDLMKNPTYYINTKFGSERNVQNYAIPVFTTNNPNPTLTIKGQRERSLFVIQGDTRENLGLNDKQWSQYTDKIKRSVTEFVKALDDDAVCEAALHYFINFDIDIDRIHLVETNPDGGFSDLLEPRDALDPVQEIFVTMLERGYIHPGMSDHNIMRPFLMPWLVDAISKDMRTMRTGKKLTTQSITKSINALFRDPDVRENDQIAAIASTQPSGKYTGDLKPGEPTRRPEIRYLALGYRLLLKRLKDNFDIEISPIFDEVADDMKIRERPSNSELWDVAYWPGVDRQQFDV